VSEAWIGAVGAVMGAAMGALIAHGVEARREKRRWAREDRLRHVHLKTEAYAAFPRLASDVQAYVEGGESSDKEIAALASQFFARYSEIELLGPPEVLATARPLRAAVSAVICEHPHEELGPLMKAFHAAARSDLGIDES